jgi:hypothetical protein
MHGLDKIKTNLPSTQFQPVDSRASCQDALALLDWRAPQIFTVEFDQVERAWQNI